MVTELAEVAEKKYVFWIWMDYRKFNFLSGGDTICSLELDIVNLSDQFICLFETKLGQLLLLDCLSIREWPKS